MVPQKSSEKLWFTKTNKNLETNGTKQGIYVCEIRIFESNYELKPPSPQMTPPINDTPLTKRQKWAGNETALHLIVFDWILDPAWVQSIRWLEHPSQHWLDTWPGVGGIIHAHTGISFQLVFDPSVQTNKNHLIKIHHEFLIQ